jgi:hypothetical protein
VPSLRARTARTADSRGGSATRRIRGRHGVPVRALACEGRGRRGSTGRGAMHAASSVAFVCESALANRVTSCPQVDERLGEVGHHALGATKAHALKSRRVEGLQGSSAYEILVRRSRPALCVSPGWRRFRIAASGGYALCRDGIAGHLVAHRESRRGCNLVQAEPRMFFPSGRRVG